VSLEGQLAEAVRNLERVMLEAVNKEKVVKGYEKTVELKTKESEKVVEKLNEEVQNKARVIHKYEQQLREYAFSIERMNQQIGGKDKDIAKSSEEVAVKAN
jgi:methyl-accepting chemotaxis protein